jgi:hypothetical protein
MIQATQLSRYDPAAERFVRFFERCNRWSPALSSDVLQTGGALPVFVGRRRYPQQVGVGFLDWLKRIAGWALPVALSGASTFLGQTREAQAQGRSLGEAAKTAIGPAAQAALGEAATQIRKARTPRQQRKEGDEEQKGSGRKGRKRSKSKRRADASSLGVFVAPKAARVGAHVYKSAPPAGPSIKYNF